jgi:outer membrane scaffolding protein for murein synthesis (MipA/OmpV family)
MRSICKLATVLLCLPALSTASEATPDGQQPLWEAGIIVSPLSAPEYRGSNKQNHDAIFLPFLIYRGEIFQTDEEGIYARLFRNDHLELELEAVMPLPSDSHHSGPRHGMPDLKPVVEFGPSLEIYLWGNAAKTSGASLTLPLHAAYAVTGGTQYVGITFAPTLGAAFGSIGHSGWDLEVGAGPIFASARQHRYFYSVDERYALPDRPACKASGGYAGAQFGAALSRDFEHFTVKGFVRYDNLRGAAFADSPLVEKKHSWMAGLGVLWKIGKSSQRVAGER